MALIIRFPTPSTPPPPPPPPNEPKYGVLRHMCETPDPIMLTDDFGQRWVITVAKLAPSRTK